MDLTIVILLPTGLSGNLCEQLGKSFTSPEMMWARPSYTGPTPNTLYGFATDKQACSGTVTVGQPRP